MDGKWIVAALLSTLLSGCAVAGRGHIPRAPAAPTSNDAPSSHPLTDPLFSDRRLIARIRCSLEQQKARDEANRASAPEPQLPDCNFPTIQNPNYSLSLSGGGYRASLYHYGAIKRLNDMGRLRDVRLVCGVSGGAVTAALLVANWNKLEFGETDGIARNLDSLVGEPLLKLTDQTLDIATVIPNALSFGTFGKTIAPDLDRELFHGLKLRSLPGNGDAPLLIVTATNLESGKTWAFSRDFVGEGMLLYVKGHDFTIAQAVAASSSFPGVLGPISFTFDGEAFKQVPVERIEELQKKGSAGQVAGAIVKGANEQRSAQGNKAMLVDGGVIDNLGVKWCATARTQYISDAGTPVEEQRTMGTWFGVMTRVVDLIHTGSTDYGYRAKCAVEGNVCWRLKNQPHTNEYGLSYAQSIELMQSARVATRFKKLSLPSKCAIMKAGYLSAASALDSPSFGPRGASLLPCSKTSSPPVP